MGVVASTFPDIGLALQALLLQSSTLKAMLGTRVFTDHLPQSQPAPCIVLFVISEIGNDVIDGPLGLDEARIQLDCYGVTRAQANEVRQFARQQIAGYRGVVDGVHIRSVAQATGAHYLTDRPEAGGAQYRYIQTQDFYVTYNSIQKVSP